IYDAQSGKSFPATGQNTGDYSPAWDPEGRYLYFMSDRFANPVLDSRDAENIEVRMTRPCLVTLRKDVKNPFANTNGLPGSVEDKKDEAKPGDKPGADKKDAPAKPIAIDVDGLADRYVAFPVPVGSYGNLGASGNKVFYLAAPITGMNEEPPGGPEAPPQFTLVAFDMEKRKAKTFLDGVTGYTIAAKAPKIAVRKGPGEVFVLDASGDGAGP